MLIIWSIILVLTGSWRFWLRFRKERQRQLMVTWPKSRPHFAQEDPDLTLEGTTNETLRWNRLREPYTFFTNREKFTGRNLLPLSFQMGLREAEEVETSLALAEEARKLTAHYNPADPNQNFLAIGHTHLSWGKVMVYLGIGILLPVFLTYSYIIIAADPQVWWQTVTFQSPGS